MTTDLLLAVTIGALFAVGTYLMMSRNLIRIMLGFLVAGHGTNLLLLSAGVWGSAPLLTGSAPDGQPDNWADPLPQAFVLTSIVITFAVVCFLLAMVYRGYLHTAAAEVADDTEAVNPLEVGAQ